MFQERRASTPRRAADRYREMDGGAIARAVDERQIELLVQWLASRGVTPTQKECRYCLQTLPLVAFVKSLRTLDGVGAICRACRNVRVSRRTQRRKSAPAQRIL